MVLPQNGGAVGVAGSALAVFLVTTLVAVLADRKQT